MHYNLNPSHFHNAISNMVNGKNIIKIEVHDIVGLFTLPWAAAAHLLALAHLLPRLYCSFLQAKKCPQVSAVVLLFVQTHGSLFLFSTLAFSVLVVSAEGLNVLCILAPLTLVCVFVCVLPCDFL